MVSVLTGVFEPRFCITSAIRNDITEKSNVFAAFIDMGKAFDWINRDVFLYKIVF